MTDHTFADAIGKTLQPSDWFLIEQSRINQFADVILDHQYIHIDPSRAAETDLGGTIAHGFLMLSLLPKLVEKSMVTPEGMVMGINYGFDKVRFLNPVRPGDQVRVTGTVLDIVDKGNGRYLQKLGVSLEIQGKDKPAIVCEWLNMFVVN
tara:strand:+ start:79 stop:528 length:450 start_codon:yes stop_codon:yes gene_type:complete